MGRQVGVLPLTGKVGGLSFFKSKSGYQVRMKGGVSADRIRTDPAYQRTRENGQEFGRAGRATRLLRTAFRSVLLKSADPFLTSRMSREMLKVIQADTVNPRGARVVQGPNTLFLQGFEFNDAAKMAGTFFAPYDTVIDRVTGTLTVTIPAFTPQNMIAAPAGATHAQLVGAGAEVNFADSNFVAGISQSDLFTLDTQPLQDITLAMALPVNSTWPLFMSFGIAFYQVVNGVSYPLNNGAFNALSLVKIDGGA